MGKDALPQGFRTAAESGLRVLVTSATQPAVVGGEGEGGESTSDAVLPERGHMRASWTRRASSKFHERQQVQDAMQCSSSGKTGTHGAKGLFAVVAWARRVVVGKRLPKCGVN